MRRGKNETRVATKRQSRKKKITKKEKPSIDNKIYIKKLINQKEIIAQFPLITDNRGLQQISIPIFRQDRLDYTPGFCLPDQFTLEFSKQQHILHQCRLSSESTMIDYQSIKQPKPSSRNSYCTICKTRFQDYKEHIELLEHLNKMRNSQCNQFIREMCQEKKILRAFMTVQKLDETNVEERFETEEAEKNQKHVYGNSKQKLYQLIKEQCNIKTKQSLQRNIISDESIFDVLVFQF